MISVHFAKLINDFGKTAISIKMEKLANLLFELSNEDRLIILQKLKQKPEKIAHLSQKLDFTVQETSRNMARLSDAHLVERKSDGSYKITEFGENALKVLPSLDFLCENADHFTSHTLSSLPHEFFCRLGDLRNCSFSDDIMLAFYEIEKMMGEAEEFLGILSDQRLISSVPFIKQAL